MISKNTGSSSKELRSGNTRSGRFFGLTSGAYGNGLQVQILLLRIINSNDFKSHLSEFERDGMTW